MPLLTILNLEIMTMGIKMTMIKNNNDDDNKKVAWAFGDKNDNSIIQF